MLSRELYHHVDPEFKHTLQAAYGETLKFCYQCGTCTAACPISRFITAYRPNKILELANLGIRNHAFSTAVLFCSACTQCTRGCPQGVRVHEVMYTLKEMSAASGELSKSQLADYEAALDQLSHEIPFPAVYSWICLGPGGDESGLSPFDSQIQAALNRYLATPVPPLAAKPLTGKPAASQQRVAVIGSGPAGLTAAWELARLGKSVTVFETMPEAGGMLRTGIPEYRLPKALVAAEIERIKAIGVDIRTNVSVNRAVFQELLQSDQYQAVYIAAGAQVNRTLRIEGETLDGVVPALQLLRQYNLEGSAPVGKKVVIIGGGNVAMDAAGAAVHCGAESVQLFCLESRKEMPAHKWEIEDVAAEGVVLNPSWGPKRIVGVDGKVTGVEFVRCSSVFDDKKRFSPVFDEKTTQLVEADMVVSAIGQATDFGFLSEWIDLNRGTVVVDPYTMETSVPGVFAGGDAVLGTASVVEAMVTGRTAAATINRYLDSLNPVE